MSSIKEDEFNTENLSDVDKYIYKTDRLKIFKVTIAICVIYGLIALVILLLGLFTSFGRYLFDELIIFSVTFVIGTLLIIIYLSNMIYNFKPVKKNTNNIYDNDVCPDYWNLERIDEKDSIYKDDYFASADNVNLNKFKYKCVPNTHITPPLTADQIVKSNGKYMRTDKGNVYVNLDDEGDNKPDKMTNFDRDKYEKYKQITAISSGYHYNTDVDIDRPISDKLSANSQDKSLKTVDGNLFTNSVPHTCDMLFPKYLLSKDKEYYADNPTSDGNTFRCMYANKCGIAWSEAGCK
jgi:hypothetical protein